MLLQKRKPRCLALFNALALGGANLQKGELTWSLDNTKNTV